MNRLSLQRPRPLGDAPMLGQIARDLVFVDAFTPHLEYGMTPGVVVAAFRAAEAGDPSMQNALFDGIVEGDCHLLSLFEKREQAVAGKPRTIQAADDTADGQLGAEVLRGVLDLLPLEHLLRFNRGGYAAAEIDWDIRRIGGRDWIIPVWFTPVPAKRFRIGIGTPQTGGVNELRIVTDYRRNFGEPLIPGKWFVLRREGDSLARSGLMRAATWPAMGKRYGWRDWLLYSEKYGHPVPIASYDPSASDEDKDIAAQIVAQIGQGVGAALPKSIGLEFAKADHQGSSGTIHSPLVDHCNSEMSKLVAGSTLTNDNKGSGGASYALGSVHDGIRFEAVLYDAGRLETAFVTDVAVPFCRYNGLSCAPPRLKIQVVRDLDPMSRARVAAVYRNELGGKVSAQQMGQELGFREPSGPDDELPGAPVKPAKEEP